MSEPSQVTASQGIRETPYRGLATPSRVTIPSQKTPASRQAVPRPDIGHGMPPVAALSPLPNLPAREGGDEDGDTALTMLWGTNINSRQVYQKIRSFLTRFQSNASDGSPKYINLLEETIDRFDNVLNIDTADLRSGLAGSDMVLYDWLVAYPREVLPIFDDICISLVQEVLGKEPPIEFRCRPYNLARTHNIRDLDPSDIDKLISISGMVTRSSSIIPDLRLAQFKCVKCNALSIVANNNGRIEEPVRCNSCAARFSFMLDHQECVFLNKQMVKMQEDPHTIPEGETPHAVTMYVYEHNVDLCRPGDRVTITGTYRAVPRRVDQNHKALHALYRTFIDTAHVARDESGRVFRMRDELEVKESCSQPASQSQGVETSQIPSTQEPLSSQRPQQMETQQETQHAPLGDLSTNDIARREAQIRELSQDPRLYDRLVASLAPNIWEMDDVKKGLLCLLFGGCPKTLTGGRIRGEVNVLLVGDPGVSKSQLLGYVHKLAPRGIYTSGKGSSAVGLTAFVSRDPETREMVLESGALVMSDKGVCCIDEFDKMSESARSMLHEAMEQQTVSIAKAGLVSTLNARCAVLACANPIGSRYNPGMSLAENIGLPPTLLTRFDLIFLLLDHYHEERDRRLARHLVGMFHPDKEASAAPRQELIVEKELLTDYIAYARARVFPELSDGATQALLEAYGDLRRDGRARSVIVATPRQLESLIRLSESQARMRLRSEVLVEDVHEAVRLWYTAMKGSTASPDGQIDMGAIITGETAAMRELGRHLPEDIDQVLTSRGTSALISMDALLIELRSLLASRGTDRNILTHKVVEEVLKGMADRVIQERGGVRLRQQ